jgi:hypothetical protein
MKLIKPVFVVLLLFVFGLRVFAQAYPDQQFVIRGIEELYEYEDSTENIVYNSETNSIELESGFEQGVYISKPVSFSQKFNRGLPSWNGHAPENQRSSFRVSMRFKISYGWSDWITVGYWDKYIWSSYGNTTFNGGKVSIDYVKLDVYINEFQFKIEFKRDDAGYESSSVKQFSFFVSDTKTTVFTDINKLVNDKPPAIFIPTNFVYQYGVDPVIGGRICSPSTLSMIIQSFGYEVDTYDFALRTNDPYWDIFGVWPRGVQSASEYGLRGTVTRYRSWTDAYNVLKNGGRIAITVGPPLFNAHLMMLAGFDDNGNPIIHNPGRSSGYGITYNKKQISESWFNKGGISYTFYDENAPLASKDIHQVKEKKLIIYPNPVEDKINIEFDTETGSNLKAIIFNTLGQQVYTGDFHQTNGFIQIDINNLIPSGTYILNLLSEKEKISKLFIKK